MNKLEEVFRIKEDDLDFLKLYNSEKSSSKQPEEEVGLFLVELLTKWNVPEMINKILSDNPLLVYRDMNHYVTEKYDLTLIYSNGVLHLKLVNMYDYNNGEKVTLSYNATSSDDGWKMVNSVGSDLIYSDLLQDKELLDCLKVSLAVSLRNLIKKSLPSKRSQVVTIQCPKKH